MSFYNEKKVGIKARSNKTCSWCGEKIQKGTPHYVLTCTESYCRYPIHEECHKEANEKCDGDMDKFLETIR